MNTEAIENKVHDEANEVTYIVNAPKTLTDGEMFKAIRIAIRKAGGKRPARGETLVIEYSTS